MSREIARQAQGGADIDEIIVHTGQHYDANMSDVFFSEMQIPKPAYYLGIGGQSHGAMTGQMIEKIEALLFEESPDLVMVYGDTNSTLAGALAASKLGIGIAHVEAGLRSFNLQMPEEINRILTDRISRLLFCPTDAAVENLEREGCAAWKTGARVILCGDVMQDGALFYKELARPPEALRTDPGFVLCTIHRQENTDDPQRLAAIIEALQQIARHRQVVLPLHPRTRKCLEQGSYDTSALTIVDPVGYLNMVWLLVNCSAVLTDSGGLQKEAYFFSKPCVTLRDETEWVELIEHGVNRLGGADTARILEAFDAAVFPDDLQVELYGGGRASERIVRELCAG